MNEELKTDYNVNIGDVTLRVKQLSPIIWRCTSGKVVVGFIRSIERLNSSWEETYESLLGTAASTVKPATEVNVYPTIRSAVRALAVAWVTGKKYTYITSNVTIIGGKAELINGFNPKTKKELKEIKDGESKRVQKCKGSGSRKTSKGNRKKGKKVGKVRVQT